MLAFLRKIRKSLIKSGSVRKYFLYAIGEILLVMIGILLAIQVNNWNDQRKQAITSKEFATSLLSEVERNILLLEEYKESFRFQKQLNLDYFRALNNPESTSFDRDSIISMTQKLGPLGNIILGKSAYEDLISSGNLETFSTKRLREQIIEMARLFETSDKSFERTDLVWNDIAEYYNRHGDIMATMKLMVSDTILEYSFDININAFVRNREFSNLLARRLWRTDRSIVIAERLHTSLIKLKGELDLYLSD